MRVAFIICGALAREVTAIIKAHGWAVDVFGIPAIDHMRPELIAPHVERKLATIAADYDRVLVVYGDCGTRGTLDTLLARHNLERIDGPHCYEMYGGGAFEQLMDEEPGTFFLTDFLVRGFKGTVWRGMGLDRYPQLKDDYFRNYKRLVYLVQTDDESLRTKAAEIAAYLGLPLEVHPTGYGLLEERLARWMADNAPLAV